VSRDVRNDLNVRTGIIPLNILVKIAKNPFRVRKCPECPRSRTPDMHGQTGATVPSISVFGSSKSAHPELRNCAVGVEFCSARNLPPSFGVKAMLQHSGPPRGNAMLFREPRFALSPIYLLPGFCDFSTGLDGLRFLTTLSITERDTFLKLYR